MNDWKVETKANVSDENYISSKQALDVEQTKQENEMNFSSKI